MADIGLSLLEKDVWIMGVLNATPDSFYAGARSTPDHALSKASQLISEGADVIDIGGESTRPGALDVPASEEITRVIPVIDAVRQQWPDTCLSIDTQKADVALQALSHGVDWVNDVSALQHDRDMAGVISDAEVPVVLMHRQGTAQTMQNAPHYVDVVSEIKSFFEERLAYATRSGIKEDRIVLDPGIGFGKNLEHNLTILRRLEELKTFGRPLLVGLSRKSFIGRLTSGSENPDPPEERLEGSLAGGLWALLHGANGLRVHDVQATRRALAVWMALHRSKDKGVA